MDIDTAKDAFGLDRLLMIGLIQFLIERQVIRSAKDMELLRAYSKSTLSGFKRAKDPVIRIQLEKTEAELEHFFSSFKPFYSLHE